MADHFGHRIGELHFVASAAFHQRQEFHHFWQQDVTANDGEVGGGVLGCWFFNQTFDLDLVAFGVADIKNAVAVGLLTWDFGDRDHVAAGAVIDISELLQAGGLAEHEVVRQQDGKRVLADEGAGAPDGMAEAERDLLAHGGDGAGGHGFLAQYVQCFALAAFGQGGFKFEGDIEMVDEGSFAAAGDHTELLDAGGAGFIDRVLNQGLINDRQHFLRHGLGGGKEACAEAGNRQNGFAKRLDQMGLLKFSCMNWGSGGFNTAFTAELRQRRMSAMAGKAGQAGVVKVGESFMASVMVGERFAKDVTFEEAAARAFAALVGDFNPAHHDEDFAKQGRFGRLIVCGPQTTGMMMAMTATFLAGKGAPLGLDFQFRFLKAVPMGVSATMEWEVVSVTPKPGLGEIVEMEGTLTLHPTGEVAVSGVGKAVVLEEGAR